MQKNRFESNIDDIFGAGRGLDVLSQELGSLGANDDFGLQLPGNGDYGTDHGRRNFLILVGPGVSGGIHDEMFSTSEIQEPETRCSLASRRRRWKTGSISAHNLHSLSGKFSNFAEQFPRILGTTSVNFIDVKVSFGGPGLRLKEGAYREITRIRCTVVVGNFLRIKVNFANTNSMRLYPYS